MDETTDEPAKGTQHGRPIVWVMLGGLALLALAFGLLRIWRSDPIPPLTPAKFYEARSRWQSVGPPDYDIQIEVRGTQPATYEVHVRDRQPELALRNGKPLTQRRTFGTWSVPGMFSTMLRDVETVERKSQPNPDPNLPNLTLRAEFDPKYNYPARYRRIEQGSLVEVSWEVTEFIVQKPQ